MAKIINKTEYIFQYTSIEDIMNIVNTIKNHNPTASNFEIYSECEGSSSTIHLTYTRAETFAEEEERKHRESLYQQREKERDLAIYLRLKEQFEQK